MKIRLKRVVGTFDFSRHCNSHFSLTNSSLSLSPLFSLPSLAAQSLSVARCTLPWNGAGCRKVKECNAKVVTGEAFMTLSNCGKF